MENERTLPEITINGQYWLVDVQGFCLVNKELKHISIPVHDMQYDERGYRFAYSKFYNQVASPDERNADKIYVNLEHFTFMDPVGVAIRYGLTAEQVEGKTDRELMEDRREILDRIGGLLTTVDIAGHTFYVDFQMQALRPKDNFHSKGIPFNELESNINDQNGQCEVTYNKRLQQFEFVDCTDLVRNPKDIIVISVPRPEVLDPIGYARYKGIDIGDALEEHPQKAHHQAKVLKGQDSWLDYIIDENRKDRGYTKRPQRKSKGMGV